jgi:hypothetical protein
MSEESQPNLIDLDLVDKVVELIPPITWDTVITGIITKVVDNMPSNPHNSLDLMTALTRPKQSSMTTTAMKNVSTKT